MIHIQILRKLSFLKLIKIKYFTKQGGKNGCKLITLFIFKQVPQILCFQTHRKLISRI